MTFRELSEYFLKLEETSSRLAITEILSRLFTHADETEIDRICYLLQGRVCPVYETTEFGLADKFLIRAISDAYGVPPGQSAAVFKETGDLGITAQKLHSGSTTGESPSVTSVFDSLLRIAQTNGTGSQERKIALVAGVLRSVDAQSARYLARIPLDKLRLGFSEITMLDALSWMLTGGKSLRPRLEEAYNVRPDLGYIAREVKTHGIEGISHVHATVGAPILSALCQRLPGASDMIEKMGKVEAEPKYDGVRTQIHFRKGEGGFVRTFSRNLEPTTDMFPELSRIGAQINADEVILDSEAVGMDPKTGKLIPFQETVTRKRKHGIESASTSVPLVFFVFDMLYRDGKDLMGVPLNTRRDLLETTIAKGDILSISPSIMTDDPAVLRTYHEEQLAKGLEGIVVKQWESPYVPGRRGYNWVKFKEEEGKTGKLTDTVDCVVLGYYSGEGKRAGFGIGAFLVGIVSGDGFVSVTKIGTGVTDEQWRDLERQFKPIISRERPKEYGETSKLLTPDYWIEPKIVVEIGADDITKSPVHGAGYALRFPRLIRIRRDKQPHQATTVEEIRAMFDQQKTADA